MDFFHLETTLMTAMCAGARVAGLMVFSPFFGSDAIALPVKAGFTVAVTALLYPVYASQGLALEPVGWAQLLLSETVIGLIFGLTLQFVFDAAQLAGQVLGVQMGFSLVSILDPQTHADTPVLSIFHQMAVLLIFLQLNVHHWMLRGIAEHLAAGRTPSASDLGVLNAALMVPARQKLVQRQNGFRAEVLPVRFGWPWILSRIAASLADTLTQFDRERVKICANDGCRWAYYDVTKGNMRRWCNDRTCGNRDRVRRARAAAKQRR